MRSLYRIMELAKAEDFTKHNAEAITKEQVDEMVSVLGYTPEEARKIFLANLGYTTGYYPRELADKVFELFDTEHPYFGRKHLTPEEIFKLGFEEGERRLKALAEKENA